MSQRAIDDEVGGGVRHLKDEGESACDVRGRAAVRASHVRYVEHLGRQVADGEDQHHDDDDARHTVLVADTHRSRRRRRSVMTTSS